MSLEIRPVRQEELPRVNELRRMVNDVHVDGRPDIFKPGFGQALIDHLYEEFVSDQSDVIVAVLDGDIAGFATVQYIRKPETPYTLPRDFYRVEEFGVDSACRRRGVATALVEYIRRDARAKGFPRIELDAWAFNEGAIAFYKGAGFNPFRVYFEMDMKD